MSFIGNIVNTAENFDTLFFAFRAINKNNTCRAAKFVCRKKPHLKRLGKCLKHKAFILINNIPNS